MNIKNYTLRHAKYLFKNQGVKSLLVLTAIAINLKSCLKNGDKALFLFACVYIHVKHEKLSFLSEMLLFLCHFHLKPT